MNKYQPAGGTPSRIPPLSTCHGFTILEAIVVIVIISALVLTATVALNHKPTVSEAATQNLRSILRYAQARAITYGHPYILNISDTEVFLQRKNMAEANRIPLPNGEKAFEVKDDTTILTEGFTLRYDKWGTPSIGDSNGENMSQLLTKYTITLTAGEGDEAITRSITISPATGFVE